MDFKTTKNPQIRAKKATNIIKRYILADSPLELCLPAPLRHKYERLLAIHDQEHQDKSKGIFGFFTSSTLTTSTLSACIEIEGNIKNISNDKQLSDNSDPSQVA